MPSAFVKFCGGCNEKYSRLDAFKLITGTLGKKVSFINHDPAVPCDIGIIISGCETECVKTKDLAPAKVYISVTSIDSAIDAIKRIKEYAGI